MPYLRLHRLLLVFTVSLFVATPAHAFSFDDLKKQAEKVFKEAESALETPTNPSTDTREPTNPSADTRDPTDDSCRSHPSAKRAHELPQGTPRGYNARRVYYIQRSLCLLGYYSGEQDSIYGNVTRQAIENYQRKRGLTVDGEPSHVVEKYLECDLTASTSKAKKDSVCNAAEQLNARYEQEDKQKQMRAAEQQRTVEGASNEIPTWDQSSPFHSALLSLRFLPELLDDPETLKSAASHLYPAEWAEIKDNEFEVRRRLPSFKERIVQHAGNQPTTYRALRGSGFGKYDFQKEGYFFPINYSEAFGLRTMAVLNKEIPIPPKSMFVSMTPDQAEALIKRTKSVTFELVFEATDAVVNDQPQRPWFAASWLLCEARRLRVYGKRVDRGYRDSSGRSVTYSVLSDPIADVDLSQFEMSSDHLSMQAQSQRPKAENSVPQTPEKKKTMKMQF